MSSYLTLTPGFSKSDMCLNNLPDESEAVWSIFQWYEELLDLQGCLQDGDFLLEERLPCMQYIRKNLSHLDQRIIQLYPDHCCTIIELLFDLAQRLSDWNLIILIQNNVSSMLFYSDIFTRISTIMLLAEAYCQIGKYGLAIETLEKQLLLNPRSEDLHDYWALLKERYSYRDNFFDLLVDKEVSLIPLERHHVHDFSWQYSPSVRELCGLPIFESDEDWYSWFDLDNVGVTKDAATFSVIHEEWGFIGSVNLQVLDGIGFYYYWLGNDFQGYGLGPRAVELLLAFSSSVLNMQCCYAKVYDHNIQSHKAIRKLGFKCLPFSIEAPYESSVFYYRGDDKPNNILFSELVYITSRIDSEMRILPSDCITLC